MYVIPCGRAYISTLSVKELCCNFVFSKNCIYLADIGLSLSRLNFTPMLFVFPEKT